MKITLQTLIVLCFCVNVSHAQHIGDIWVGITDSDQLKVTFVPECEILLTDSGSTIFPGWTNNIPGFDHIVTYDPNSTGEIYPMSGSHDIRLEIVSLTNFVNGDNFQGFHALNNVTFDIADEPGNSIELGSSNLHIHPIFFINNDENNNTWIYSVDPDWVGRVEVTFKLTDSGSYSDSEPFTIVFTNDEYMLADINHDNIVDMHDLAALGAQWDQTGCVLPDWCQGADINQDGQVSTGDLFWLAHKWLDTPEDCSLNGNDQ